MEVDEEKIEVKTQVTLTWYEMSQAAIIACMRNISCKCRGVKNRFGASGENAWDISIEGACGEIAFAKVMNLYWSGGVDRAEYPDVGNYQIRTARPGRRLILHPSDHDEEIFVLINGESPNFTLTGWILGHEGKKKEFWTDPTNNGRPAYFVPINSLHPINSLPKLR